MECLSRCYIPIFACLSGYISFCFTMHHFVNWFVAGGTTIADIYTPNKTPQNGCLVIRYQASHFIVWCKPEVLSVVTRDEYEIQTKSYSTFKVNWTPSTQIEQVLPLNYAYLKTVFLIVRAVSIINNSAYYLHTFCREDIYQHSELAALFYHLTVRRCPSQKITLKYLKNLKNPFMWEWYSRNIRDA